jgi:hypothetical protein
VLAGIVLLVLGLVNIDSERGRAMLVSGMLLGSLGGLDTAVREHVAGYKPHTTVLAGIPAVGLAAILYFAAVPWPALIAAALATFAAGVALLARDYQRRAG